MLIITVLGVVLVIAALSAVLIVPQFGKISELDAQLKAAEQEAQSAQFLLAQRREVRDRAAVVDAKRMQLLSSFPEDPELTGLILELQELAYDVEVDLRLVEPQSMVIDPEKPYVAMPIKLQFYADWSESIEYLQKLDSLGRQLRVVSFAARPLDPTPYTDLGVDITYYSADVEVLVEAYSVPKTEEQTPVTTEPAM